MLTLVAPSQVHFTSLSSTSIPPLRTYLPQAHTHSESIMEVLRQTNQSPAKVCLLDPKAEKVLAPEDAEKFEWFLYGGILGDDPPRDRTAELRKLGFEGRHLGEKQMTTDTAVGVTKMVVEDGLPLDKIPFIVSLSTHRPKLNGRIRQQSHSVLKNPSKCHSVSIHK